MPLKHFTETVLVIVLVLVTIVTGIAISILPPIPEGFVPWGIVFVAALIYPAIVYPLLKTNRADYTFRALHFAPVAITLGWLFLQIAMLKEPRTEVAETIYTWGFGAAPVIFAIFLLAVFCLHVIRRRIPRLTAILFLLLPFTALAYLSETRTHWDTKLAGLLWSDTPVQIAKTSSSSSSMLSASSRGEKNLSSSSVPEEEAWRQKLRAVELGKVHSSVSVGGTLKGVNAALNLTLPASSGSVVGTRRIAKKPRTKLPKSGGETEAMGLLAIVGFAGTVHLKAKKRVIE